MNKIFKTISLSLLSGVLGAGVGLPLAMNISNNVNIDYSIKNISDVQQSTEISSVIPSEVNDQNANLSTSNGPVTFMGNTITALDWYGNKLWSIDFSKKVPDDNGKFNGNYTAMWKRAWFNWDYNRSTNTIWVLGFWSKSTKKQPLFEINASTGEIKSQFDITYKTSVNANTTYRFITALSSGKVMIYGGAGTTYNAQGLLYDPSTKTLTTISGNSNSTSILPINDTTYGKNYNWYFFNLIPIANNKNLVEVLPFSKTSTTEDSVAAVNASYDVYFLLVDDNLNMVETSGTWASKVKVANGMQEYRNTQVTPQRDYYTMLDGKVVTVVYNTAIVIDATNNTVKFGVYPMTDNKWIKSWAFDSNQNLYFKFKNEAKIYKVSGDSWKVLNDSTHSSISPFTYLDLAGINNIKQYANDLAIYNVYGYTGQLMLINSKYNAKVDTTNSTITESNNPDNYGLAVAIVQNSHQQNKGDYKGILNGADSFQKASDFELSQSVIDSKIPSEITKSDITTLNNSFFKDGNTTGFEITNINDETGEITIKCDLYQIPWFASTLPNDVSSRTITHSYVTTNKITNKVSWKTLSSSTDYDFLNMKPSNIKAEDVQNLDPFQVSFQSQTITDGKGNQLYPKKTYSVSEANDATGNIKVSIEYQYVPMGVTYTNNNTSVVKTYRAEHTYTVFKNTDNASFNFIGQNSSSDTTVDVTSIAQLKFLLNANILPSSFKDLNDSNDSTNSIFLQFINTESSKGYPISKMHFSVVTDDTNGTLEINATMPSEYSPNGVQENFSVKYTNLNKLTNYSFSFKTPSAIENQKLSNILASAITDGDIINNFISYSGFNSNDFTITKSSNDTNGTLAVSISLNSNYASEVGNGNVGFVNYQTSYVFSGFMTKEQYNQRYNVSFIDDSNEKLISLKQMQASQVYDAFQNNKSLTVGGTVYTNLKDLIEKLLVSELGTMVPKNWANESSINATMYVDNSQGTISFYVMIPKSLMSGANSDLYLIANYTGFVKGNVDNTNDNFSFVANNMLKSYLVSNGSVTKEQFEAFTPTTFTEWLNKDDNVKKLITYQTGQYVNLLNSDTGHSFTIVKNNTQRSVTIYVHFYGLIDSKSLSEYSITYSI